MSDVATDITAAAHTLNLRLFGELASFRRIGRVRSEGGILHVNTCVPPDRWPADRPAQWDGFTVQWHYRWPGSKEPEAL
jgi:hypothetical protein